MDDWDEKQAEQGECYYEHHSMSHEKYGVFPLELRFGADSTGLNLRPDVNLLMIVELVNVFW